MKKYKSQIQTGSESFKKNREAYDKIIGHYYSVLASNIQGHSEELRNKHLKRGKLLVRDRIDRLIDAHTPFLELSPLAAYNKYNNEFPSAGIVTGIGIIQGRETIIVANDATVKGGTYVEETIKKHVRAQEIALENEIPIVYLVDSGGVFLPDQAKVFPDKDDFGRIFYNQSLLSARGIPQIALVLGSCTAGGAYIPAMSDETIIVKNQGTIFLGGPPLVKAATGEEVTAEELGGGEVHTYKSGVADHLADDDLHALQICRDIFESFPNDQRRIQPFLKKVKEPAYDIHELNGIVPASLKESYDVREVVARLVDGSEFNEFKTNYGSTLFTAFAHIMGHPVGILGNNGILFSESALKGTHFIELCCYRKIPIIFLQHISGFIVGKSYEHGGIARDGAKMVHAVANANVPKITVIIGGSFGAGNYAMSGRAYNPRFLFMWPHAKISVMGGEQAANVLITVKEDQLKAKGMQLEAEEKEKIRTQILKKYDEEGSAYFSTSHLWDDGIILPQETRNILGLTLNVVGKKTVNDPAFGVFRM